MKLGLLLAKYPLICALLMASGISFAQTRGPYLQMGSQTSVTIRWRTASAADSKVELGTVYGTYPLAVTDATSVTEHIVSVTGLTPDTKYYYKVGSTTGMGASDPDKFFITLPPSGTTRKLRFAAFGDCGRNDNSFQTQTLAQYRAYLSANSIDAPDAWLLLGDNAYNDGTDAQYTSGFFNAYGSSILLNHKIYPAPGNHDYYSTSQSSRLGAYYQNFTMPTNAECGGTASGTEAFYSFDVGDVHFLSLDSYGTESGSTRIYDTSGAQVTWVKNDLLANNKKWTIAYWHHPPYTKGSHDSDSESELRNIRENFIRILERNGVDMIICGHSHDYERSYLLNGYYKSNPGDAALTESDFRIADHTASSSSAFYDNSSNSCPYTYTSGKYKHGTVYVVAGSSGADGSVKSGYPHDALFFSQDDGGMLYFEIEDNRLDAKFIRRDGVIADRFTIMKDVNQSSSYNVTVGDQVTLTASWPGDYTWNTSATAKSITVTPVISGTTNYTVSDAYGCIADQFTVQASGVLSLPGSTPKPGVREDVIKKFGIRPLAAARGLRLEISAPYNCVCNLRLYDLSGRERKLVTMNVAKGVSVRDLTIAGGVYVYEVKNDKGQRVSGKVVVK